MPVRLPGREVSHIEAGRRMHRHHHLGAYAALLIEGSCAEAGDLGRYHLRPGDVIIHRSFEAHQDLIGQTGARFINLALQEPGEGIVASVVDLDAIVRAFERDARDAAALLRTNLRPHRPIMWDWPDLLAAELGRSRHIRLDGWAERHGLSPASLSRGFRKAYGISPKRFRFELISSRAARRVQFSTDGLSHIAASCGFSDQAHMSRAFRSLFDLTPTAIRRLG